MSFPLRSALLGSTLVLAVAAAPAARASISYNGDVTLIGADSLQYNQSPGHGLKTETDTESFTVGASSLLTDIEVGAGANVTSYSYVLKNSSGATVGSYSATKLGTNDIGANMLYNLASGSYSITITTSLAKAATSFSSTTLTSVSAVPLPAALPLFGSALVGVGLLGRRRRLKSVEAA